MKNQEIRKEMYDTVLDKAELVKSLSRKKDPS